MRRLSKPLAVLLVLMLAVNLLAAIPVSASEQASQVKVAVNNEFLTFDIQPFIEKGRVLVPVRPLCEALGAAVEWDAKTRTVTAKKGDTVAKITIGSKIASITERGVTEVVLEVPAKIVSGRTVVPLRFIAEAFGTKVQWDAATRLVRITVGGGWGEKAQELALGTLSPLDPPNLFSSNGAWQRLCSTGFSHVHLVRFDPDLNVIPCVAERWEVSPDGKSIKFFLRKGVKWHDGREVTAEDVKFTFEYKKKHNVGWDMNTARPFLENAEVVDKYTVILNLKEPVVMLLLKELAVGYLIPKHIWENVDEPLKYTDKKNVIGCGPYIFEGFDQATQTAIFRANHDYFQGAPSVEKVKIKYYKNFDQVVLALKKGEIDAIADYSMPVPGSYASTLEGDKNINLGLTPGLQVPAYLAFCYKNYPMKEKKFREAVAYAINYENIVRSICGKYGEVPGKGIVPPAMPGYDPSIPKLEYNPQKARELLASLKITEPVYVMPQTKPGKEEVMIRVAEMVCRYLKEVGIDARIDQEVIGNYDKWKEKAWRKRDFGILVGYMTVFGVLGDAGGTYFIDHPNGYGTCADPEYIKAYEKVIYAQDNTGMAEGVKEMQQYHARELPGIALAWDLAIYPYRTDKFDGWVMQKGLGPVCYQSLFNLRQK
jgi:peptide/nickel transport system substrate-binding protein